MIGITTSSSIVVVTIEMTTKGGWKYYCGAGRGGRGRLVLHHGDFSIHVVCLVWLVAYLISWFDVRCILLNGLCMYMYIDIDIVRSL